jgi:hypothetical protein
MLGVNVGVPRPSAIPTADADFADFADGRRSRLLER